LVIIAQLGCRLWAADAVDTGAGVVILVLAAAALLLWPGRPNLPLTGVGRGGPPAVGRARAGGSGPGRPRRYRPVRLPVPGTPPVTAAAAAGLATGVLLGILPGLAAALAAFTAGRLVRSAACVRRSRRELAELAVGLRLLARELRSGASAPQACGAAASAASGAAAELLENLGREVRFAAGGPTDARRSDGDPAEAATIGRRLRAALRLSARRGIPLADLVEAFAVDVEARAALADRRATEVAGPQLSGYLLAALPAFGLILGAAMGAAPLTVLLHTGLGQLLLLVGVSLSCLGLGWISRIVRG